MKTHPSIIQTNLKEGDLVTKGWGGRNYQIDDLHLCDKFLSSEDEKGAIPIPAIYEKINKKGIITLFDEQGDNNGKTRHVSQLQ